MKKFTISSDQLKPALKTLSQAVNSKSVLPILKNIYCKVTDKKVEMICSDLDITIFCRMEAVTEDEFELLLPFEFLNDVVSLYKAVPVTIEHPSARKAKIICDEDVYDVNSLGKLEEYPTIPATPKKNSIAMDADFVTHLQEALITVSKDELRPSMQKVIMDIKKTGLTIVSTDASSLYRYNMDMEVTKEDLLQEEQIQLSAKMIKALEGIEAAELSWTQKNVCVKNESITVIIKKYEEKYPNYEAVIPALDTYPANLSITKESLAAALHKTLVSGNSSKQADMLLKKEIGVLHFESVDSDSERKTHVRAAGDYTGEIEKVSINAQRLLKMLDQVEADQLNLHIHSETKAILISAEDKPNYLGLIMPLLS